jgi:hypothetical protein
MTYRGQVRNGQIVLDPGANLRDGAVVEVTEMDQAAGTPAEGRRDSPGQNGFSGREAELLQQINTGPSADLWTRYHDLIHKRDAAVLTLAEQRELIELSDRIEQANASRLALAAELARLRGVALATILRDLGIPGGARA